MSTDQQPAKKKGGRPRKHPEGARRPTLAFRVRDEMREHLEAGAKARNLSISEEVERKLAFMRTLAEDPETEAVIMALVAAVNLVRTVTGKSWKDDKDTAVMTAGAINTAGAIVLTPHLGADLTGLVSRKAAQAGEAIGHQALGLLLKLPNEALVDIGRDEMTDYRLAVAGVPEADLEQIRNAIKTPITEPPTATHQAAEQQTRHALLASLLRGDAPADPAPEPAEDPAAVDEAPVKPGYAPTAPARARALKRAMQNAPAGAGSDVPKIDSRGPRKMVL